MNIPCATQRHRHAIGEMHRYSPSIRRLAAADSAA